MKFEERGCEKVKRIGLVFVYFLVKDGEVVYVGQTKNGTSRLAAHKDKDYNEAYLMYCSESQLDELEDKYIEKYTPKYNKQPNFVMNVSLQRIRTMAREELQDDSINIRHIKNAVRELGIKPFLIDLTPYVKKAEAEAIIENIAAQRGYYE